MPTNKPLTVIISWVAWFYDFQEDGKPNLEGPTYDMHKRYFDPKKHGKHMLLTTGDEDDTRGPVLLNRLKRDFPNHQIELHFMDVQDPFDFQELRFKSERALEMVKESEIEILYSNGTSPMRTVWLVLHLEKNGYHTHLIQGKERRVTRGEPKFQEIEVDSSLFAHGIHIRALEQDHTLDEPLRLNSLEPLYYRANRIGDVEKIATLIEGESGTGKEVMARYIHEHSAHKHRKPVIVNCAAMGNDDLLESRLFGFEKNTFTGADEARDGLFMDAHNSTIFLDEIGDIGKSLQQALLRVLQEREVIRVGASHGKPIEVRVIAATNKNLRKECEAGRFRWDLYYRLTQTRLRLPPLRTYSNEDKMAFVDYFLKKKAGVYKRPLLRISPPIKEWLMLYHFPGNIRELENLITHFYVFADRMIELKDLPEDYQERITKESYTLEYVKQEHIRHVVRAYNGKKMKAAEVLGITLNTVKKYLI